MTNTPQVNEAMQLVRQLIPLVENAERNLSSARTWSFLDVFGGGALVDVIKHVKLDKASDSMNQVNYLMQRLQVVLGSIRIPEDYKMRVGGFATFADFLWDGAIVDVYMLSKIMSSLKTVRDLKGRLYSLKEMLERM